MKVQRIEKDSKDDIQNLMEEYWKKIFPKNMDDSNNIESEQIAENVRCMQREGVIIIIEQNIEYGIKRLKNNKAVDMDGMMREFLKSGGETLN